MKNNIRLSATFAALAVFIIGVGIESPETAASTATAGAATSWVSAFPVAQAGFAEHKATKE